MFQIKNTLEYAALLGLGTFGIALTKIPCVYGAKAQIRRGRGMATF